ncbi:MAG: glycosyltransferase [Oscillospiraceae bacterium]|nr:glycosyltransferase [Oscillospiraceae bacterium]
MNIIELKKNIRKLPGVLYWYRKIRYAYMKRITSTEEDIIEVLCRRYKKVFGKPLNLSNPQTFNEKMSWSMIFDHDPLRSMLADKYLVRDFIRERIGENHLIPLLGVWEDARDIDFSTLPQRFVLKCNHASGLNIIVKDKSKLNIKKTCRTLNSWLKINHATYNLELHYANISPKIIAEAYMEDAVLKGQLLDHRFICFNGEPHFVYVDIDWLSTTPSRNVYDLSWTLQPWRMKYPNTTTEHPMPTNFNEMVDIARKLCKGFSHVRVDLYNISGKIYFAEMTFAACAGRNRFIPSDYDAVLGELWTLPERNESLNTEN